ncbi:hypothetical protein QF028_002256 [Neobacillus sp. B4I6]
MKHVKIEMKYNILLKKMSFTEKTSQIGIFLELNLFNLRLKKEEKTIPINPLTNRYLLDIFIINRFLPSLITINNYR